VAATAPIPGVWWWPSCRLVSTDTNLPERLKGLSPQDAGACIVAERALGATALAWELPSRTGTVDAMLTGNDGRTHVRGPA
jgi:hypothetical protein